MNAVSFSVIHVNLAVVQVGDAKDPVRKEVRLLFRELCSFYPPNKLFNHIMDGLKSKNARLRTGIDTVAHKDILPLHYSRVSRGTG